MSEDWTAGGADPDEWFTGEWVVAEREPSVAAAVERFAPIGEDGPEAPGRGTPVPDRGEPNEPEPAPEERVPPEPYEWDPYRDPIVPDTAEAAPAPPPVASGGRVARNTAIFSVATAFSRVAGMGREIVAAALFGTTAAASAFTIASQLPNLLANLFAQAALSAAFVPVFTELLQRGRKREAVRLASSLFWIILIGLGAIAALGIVLAHAIVPLFTGLKFTAADSALTAGLAQVLFPVLLLLGLTGLLVGILQSYDRFTIPAVAPAIWNLIIIVVLVVLRPHLHPGIYAYAIAWLAATVVQFLLIAWALREIDFRLSFTLDWRDPLVRRVFVLMIPVTIGLGIVNLDQLLNAVFGAFVSPQAPRAIDAAFRIYMLPQGIFSVAVATVLFPTLSRLAAQARPSEMRRRLGNGMRQINLLLIPSAALIMVLTTPIVRLVYQRGTFTAHSTHLTSIALFWFAFSLPFGGLNLLLTRTFFAVKRPWIPTGLAAINMVVDIIVSVALYKPLGIAGLVIGTAAANVVMTALQLRRLRAGFNGRLEGAQTIKITVRILVASAIMAAGAWLTWAILDSALGRSLVAQLIAVGGAVAVAIFLYGRLVLAMRVPEARQIQALLLGRVRGRATA